MPIYEYACESCEKQFDVLKKMSDQTPEPCPECGRPAERLISTPGFRRKSGPAPSCGPVDCGRTAGGG